MKATFLESNNSFKFPNLYFNPSHFSLQTDHRPLDEMDVEEWDLLRDDEFHDDGKEIIFSRKYGTDQGTLFKTDYFICPPPNSHKFLQPTTGKPQAPEVVKEIYEVPAEINMEPSVITQKITASYIGAPESDQDMVSQVFFDILKKNEFVDMIMGSPKSGSKGIMPQIDVGTFQFEDDASKIEIERELVSEKINLDSDMKEDVEWEENNGGLNIWKWGSTGIGAICSFGVAAATICIFILGSSQQRNRHNQKLRFQTYTDDNKRQKHVVHHATKLNEAMAAARGVPLARAHITFGGYYDDL